MHPKMEYRRLGRSGLKVSLLALGAWVTFGEQVTDDVAEQVMLAARDAGVNFFDNAEVYADGRAEIVMGRVFKRQEWRRDSFVVSSKVFWGGDLPNQTGLSRKHVIEACHAALSRLDVDYLDLYYCHRPDPDTPIEETVHAMHDLVSQGKVLYWGTSEWSGAQIREAWELAGSRGWHRPVVEQPQYNMFWRRRVEEEYRDLYEVCGLGTTTFSPLMCGLLTGKYLEGIPAGSRVTLPGFDWLKDKLLTEFGPERRETLRKLARVASDLGASLAQLAIAWCLANHNVSSVITGASSVGQFAENLGALDVLPRLTDDVRAGIGRILAEERP